MISLLRFRRRYPTSGTVFAINSFCQQRLGEKFGWRPTSAKLAKCSQLQISSKGMKIWNELEWKLWDMWGCDHMWVTASTEWSPAPTYSAHICRIQEWFGTYIPVPTTIAVTTTSAWPRWRNWWRYKFKYQLSLGRLFLKSGFCPNDTCGHVAHVRLSRQQWNCIGCIGWYRRYRLYRFLSAGSMPGFGHSPSHSNLTNKPPMNICNHTPKLLK